MIDPEILAKLFAERASRRVHDELYDRMKKRFTDAPLLLGEEDTFTITDHLTLTFSLDFAVENGVLVSPPTKKDPP